MTAGKTITRQRLHSAVLPAACWVWTRAVLLMFVYRVIPYASHSDITGDVKLYNHWSLILGQGHFPSSDPQWQYPPGAALVVALPRVLHDLTGISYYTAFYLLALLADLVTFLLVLYSCWQTAERRAQAEHREVRTDYTGVWAYTAAIFMIGPIVFGRYDVFATMAATVGLVASARGTAAGWRLRGVAIGIGAMLKLWPAALLFGVPRGREGRRAVVWALLGAAVPSAVLAVLLPGAFSFVSAQNNRGLEVEAVLATPFLIARHLGYHGRIVHEFGAFQVSGPGIGAVSSGCLLLTAAGFGWLLWWRRRAARALGPGGWNRAVYYDAALVAVLIASMTSRVLSPQYLVWFVALIALCLSQTQHSRPGGTALAKPCWLVLAAVSLTQVDFPLTFSGLIHGQLAPALFVTARNLLLVVATAWAMRLLWTSTVPKAQAAHGTLARRKPMVLRKNALRLSVPDTSAPEGEAGAAAHGADEVGAGAPSVYEPSGFEESG